MIKIEKFFTSNWNFEEYELELRSKFQMLNIAILLSSIGLIFGISINYIKDISGFIPVEVFILFMNLYLIIFLRSHKNSFVLVSLIVIFQYTFLFLFLMYSSKVEELKYIWIFTYPIILLFSQSEKHARLWMLFMLLMLLVLPIQQFIEVDYSLFQVSYISFVLIIIAVIIHFYQKKIDEFKNLVLKQQNELKVKIEELSKKDKMLTIQSKQAVMGEMMSMIAHQWRQPLSAITLSISNIQVKHLLGGKVDGEFLDKTLENISDTAVYLSDTIDDFKTYFSPNKELSSISTNELMKKVIALIQARLDETDIKLELSGTNDDLLHIYTNELIQVILNILNNAIDELIYINKIDPNIKITFENDANNVEISIKDNGFGIKEKDLDLIFEPYFSTKGKNGTGLGLYMSQMIMQKQFNSKIEVLNSHNGSMFSMVIPKELS